MRPIWVGRYIKLGLFAAFFMPMFLFLMFGGTEYLSLTYIKSKQAGVDAYYQANPFFTSCMFFVVYVLIAGLSIPGVVFLKLFSGAIFGVVWGSLISSFASSVGAILAFLMSRFVFADWVRHKFPSQVEIMTLSLDQHGRFYLFSLRLMPMVPFFLVNWIMGLARYPLKDFYWVTQLGMLPVTIIYVNLGTELAKIDTLDNILSPSVWVSIAILAFLPLIGKRLTHYFVPVEKSAHRPDRQSR